MTYVTSDIHGCYEQYRLMLKKINFSDNDILYVLGDVIDYGTKPMEVLRDMSMRGNVIPIAGNHEYFALNILSELLEEIMEGNVQKIIHIAEDVANWQAFGGTPTIQGFSSLSKDERVYLYEYLTEFSLYELIAVKGQQYVLTHTGVPENANLTNLHVFSLYDYITAATIDYNRVYFKDAILVTGHTPTFHIGEKYRGKVYRRNNHLAIDTGGVFNVGGTFSCVCLDTGEDFYIS